MTRNNKGFTLIELLVVIAIIGVLVTIVVVAINPVKLINDSKDAKRRGDVNQIKTALQSYYNDQKSYPTTATSIPFGAVWTVSGVTYMRQVPNDTGGSYTYTGVGTCATTCTDYQITANLNTRTTSDTNSLNKCGITPPAEPSTIDFAVCND